MFQNKTTIAMSKKFPHLFAFFFAQIVHTVFSISAGAQSVTITGTVTGNNKELLSGVTVTDKHSKNTAVSNVNGQFSFKASSSV